MCQSAPRHPVVYSIDGSTQILSFRYFNILKIITLYLLLAHPVYSD